MSCFGVDASQNTFIGETVLYIVFPFALIGVTALVSYVSASRSVSSRQDVDVYSALEVAKSSAVGVAVVTLFLLQPTLVKQFAVLFSCSQMGAASGDIFLKENLEVRCYTPEHWVIILSLGLPLLICYVIGIPAGIYRLLSTPANRTKVDQVLDIEAMQLQTHLDDTDSLAAAALTRQTMPEELRTFESNYGFIFLGYHRDAYLWELVVMARKGALSVCGVALGHEPRAQVMLGLLIMGICTCLQLKYDPFGNDSMNQFELFSLCVSTMTFFLGVFTMDSDSPGSPFDAASLLAFVLNLTYICVAIPVGISFRIKAKERIKIREKIQLSGKDYLKQKLGENDSEIELQPISVDIVPAPPPEPADPDKSSSSFRNVAAEKKVLIAESIENVTIVQPVDEPKTMSLLLLNNLTKVNKEDNQTKVAAHYVQKVIELALSNKSNSELCFLILQRLNQFLSDAIVADTKTAFYILENNSKYAHLHGHDRRLALLARNCLAEHEDKQFVPIPPLEPADPDQSFSGDSESESEHHSHVQVAPPPGPEPSSDSESDSESEHHSHVQVATPPGPDPSSGSDSDSFTSSRTPPQRGANLSRSEPGTVTVSKRGSATADIDTSDESSSADEGKEKGSARNTINPEQKRPPRASVPLVRTKKAWKCTRPEQQLSFGKGDVIRVVKAEGKWHLGVLIESNTYPLTNKTRYYPSNYVTPLSDEDRARDSESESD